MSAASDRLEFAAVLGGEGVPARVIREVLRDAGALHRLAEAGCNGYQTPSGDWDEAGQARAERREERLEARIREALESYGIVPTFQGDPRGAVVKLRLPSGRANDWGGEGVWCVP